MIWEVILLPHYKWFAGVDCSDGGNFWCHKTFEEIASIHPQHHHHKLHGWSEFGIRYPLCVGSLIKGIGRYSEHFGRSSLWAICGILPRLLIMVVKQSVCSRIPRWLLSMGRVTRCRRSTTSALIRSSISIFMIGNCRESITTVRWSRVLGMLPRAEDWREEVSWTRGFLFEFCDGSLNCWMCPGIELTCRFFWFCLICGALCSHLSESAAFYFRILKIFVSWKCSAKWTKYGQPLTACILLT